jgi:fructokinase
VARQVRRSDVVKVSSEDLSWLYPGEHFTEVAARWLASGPALVVVTLGGDGGYGLSRTAEVTRPAARVPVVDTVGAGDAFTAGLLDGLRRADLLGGDRRDRLASVDADALANVLDFAIRVASLTCARPGADPPTRAELAQS